MLQGRAKCVVGPGRCGLVADLGFEASNGFVHQALLLVETAAVDLKIRRSGLQAHLVLVGGLRLVKIAFGGQGFAQVVVRQKEVGVLFDGLPVTSDGAPRLALQLPQAGQIAVQHRHVRRQLQGLLVQRNRRFDLAVCLQGIGEVVVSRDKIGLQADGFPKARHGGGQIALSTLLFALLKTDLSERLCGAWYGAFQRSVVWHRVCFGCWPVFNLDQVSFCVRIRRSSFTQYCPMLSNPVRRWPSLSSDKRQQKSR